MEPTPPQELQLRDYVRIFRKRYRLVIGILASVIALVVIYSLVSPNVYQSWSTVQVQGQSGYVIKASAQMDDSSGNLTPTALSELILRQPYQELASSLVALAQGYDMDLTARRSQDDMVQLFEEDLFRQGLPAYFGRLALETPNDARRRLAGLGPSMPDDDQAAPGDASSLARQLSSEEKDEAIKQAGALAALARRLGIDPFGWTADQVGPRAIQIMNSPLVRGLKTDPLRGRRWEALPPLERAAAVQAADRDARKHDPDREDKREVRERYSAREIKDTGMLAIGFDSFDPDRAMLGADAMVDVVVWKNQYQRKEEAQRIRQVAENALYGPSGRGGVVAMLSQTERRLRDFKNRNRMPDLELVQESRSKQLLQLQSDLQAATDSALGAREQVEVLSVKLARTPPTVQSPSVSDNPAVSGLKHDLALAQSDLKAALAEYTDQAPKVQSLKDKVASLENDLRIEQSRKPTSREVHESSNPTYQQLEADLLKWRGQLAAAIAERDTLRAERDRAQAELASMPNTQYRLSPVMRDESMLLASLKTLQEKYLDAQLNEATKTSNAKIVELALEPGKKVRPKRTMNVALGLFLGLFLGMAGAVLAEMADGTVRAREEVERALPGVPVLAAIPPFSGDHPLVVPAAGGSAVAEAFRALRSSIRFLGFERPLRTLIITSPGFGEGKSTVAANLAAAMAQSGQRVVLVDADLRKPAQHEILGIDNRVGLTSVLADQARLDAALQPTVVEGLSLLPSGPKPPNPAELLDSPAMRRLAEELGERADIVLFDTPPVTAVTDAALLGSLSDGIILVVGGGQTSRESLLRAKRLVDHAHAHLLGIALNRAELSRSDGYYERYRQYAEGELSPNGHSKSERRARVKAE